jgi:hypothetical protein
MKDRIIAKRNKHETIWLMLKLWSRHRDLLFDRDAEGFDDDVACNKKLP